MEFTQGTIGRGLEIRMTRRQALTRTLMLGLSAPIVTGLLSACGSDDKKATNTVASAAGTSTSGTTPSAGGQAHEVDMNDTFKFSPDQLTVSVGDTVTWKNSGKMPHTSTCDPSKAANKSDVQQPDGGDTWDSGMLSGGQTYSHTFKVAGDYKYFCIPHESLGMIGTITVKA